MRGQEVLCLRAWKASAAKSPPSSLSDNALVCSSDIFARPATKVEAGKAKQPNAKNQTKHHPLANEGSSASSLVYLHDRRLV